MAKLYFRYGTMNSGKSMDILKVKHNYEEQGKNVILLTTSIDDRYGVGVVKSRTGLSSEAHVIEELGCSISDFVQAENNLNRISCVLIDESQFLLEDSIMSLVEVVDQLNIPVICYGLKNDFQNQLFEGSKRLIEMADKVEEIKTICWFCESKAIMNMRMHDGSPVYHGEQIQTGGNESYLPVCRKHYFDPPINIEV